ncbi:MAG: hypothetical protein ACO3AF_03860 [Flavobacteriales bacterium]
MVKRIFFIGLLALSLAASGFSQNYSQGGIQFMIPTRDFSTVVFQGVNLGVGFFGSNRYFLNDNVSLKADAGYTLLINDFGDIGGQVVDLMGGGEYCFRPEGYILRPYAGGTMGLTLVQGSAFFGLRPQVGVMVELGEFALLDIGLGQQFMFGRFNLHGFTPKIGLIMNFNTF